MYVDIVYSKSYNITKKPKYLKIYNGGVTTF
jgi:hypothetical protein